MSRSNQPQPIANLLDAAVAYDEAKLALELHEGKAAGAEYALKLGNWRGATANLATAARAYAITEREATQCEPQS